MLSVIGTRDLDTEPVQVPRSPAVGQVVAGRYRIGSLLGAGGTARVWLAEDQVLQRPVALKWYHAHVRSNAYETRVVNEARAAAAVNHSGIVRIYDLVRERGVLSIVMEPLSGWSLAQLLSAEGPMPIHRATDLGLRLLDVLQAVHRAGIVHRDVKPANIHICGDGRLVLTDFGIASFVDAASGAQGETMIGSPGYMSPEQVQGDVSGPRADLFSFGATLFAMVEGHGPFDRGDLTDSMLAILRGTAKSTRAGRLGPIIDALLVKHPERRLTADQARAALTELRREAIHALTPDDRREATS